MPSAHWKFRDIRLRGHSGRHILKRSRLQTENVENCRISHLVAHLNGFCPFKPFSGKSIIVKINLN